METTVAIPVGSSVITGEQPALKKTISGKGKRCTVNVIKHIGGDQYIVKHTNGHVTATYEKARKRFVFDE